MSRKRGRGKNKGPPGHGRSSIDEAFVKSSSPYYSFRSPGLRNDSEHATFSLADEARSTHKRHSDWAGAEVKLRHSRVTFVSAAADEDEHIDVARKDPVSHSHSRVQRYKSASGAAEWRTGTPQTPADVESPGDAFAQLHLRSDGSDPRGSPPGTVHEPANVPSPPQVEISAEFFAVDLIGTASAINTGLPPPLIKSRSLSPSSDEDVLLFQGRNRPRPNAARTTRSPLESRKSPVGVRKITDDVEVPAPVAATTLGSSHGAHGVNGRPAWDDTTVKWSHGSGRRDPGKVRGAGKLPKGFGAPRNNRTARKQYEDEIFADYAQNMRDNGALEDPNSAADVTRSSANEDETGWTDTEEAPERSQSTKKSKRRMDGWSSGDLDDFDNLSTTEELLGEVDCILKKRHRRSGVQYLVVLEGCSTDEARWTLSSALTSDKARKAIEAYEEDDAMLMQIAAEEDSFDEPSDDEDRSDEDDSDSEEAFRDEEDLIQRRISRMTDEKIARLLAKQEELGMGAEKLLLFDDDEMSDEDDDADLGMTSNTSRRRTRTRGGGRSRNTFPDATLLAEVLDQDPYNGFDVMDWERPSLKRKSKGRKASLPFELSDAELEASLQNAWAADREKKRAKKQEREELRAQGLLGKNNKFKPDTKAKYRDGMTIGHVRGEIRGFLMSTYDSHALPPMDKRDRKLIHDFASAFNLKSKSVGKGKSRFPVLYKTTRTREYDEDVFHAIEARLERRFLPRMDKRPGGKKGGTPRRGGGGVGNAAVRDGDVVGAEAPELGAENRGRAMLEKMGWSMGTALGAVNNKGILLPIEHVVKVSKFGLG